MDRGAQRARAERERRNQEVARLEEQLRAAQAREQEALERGRAAAEERDEAVAAAAAQEEAARQAQGVKQAMEVRVKALEAQVADGEAEFETLGELLAEKESEVAARDKSLAELRSTMDALRDEVDRQQAMLRRKGIGKPAAEKEDVCLSARSFCENDLIALRDEALEVKQRQIQLINENNQSLMRNVDHLEAEMQRMQVDIVHRDKKIASLEAAKQSALDRIKELERQVQVEEGREAAMEVATKQNSDLLQLLQQQETLSSELEERNTVLEEELSDTARKHKTVLIRCTEYETQAITAQHEVQQLKKELMTARGTLGAEAKALRDKLDRLERESRDTIEEQREEIRSRRERHYQMLSKQQAAEAAQREAEEAAAAARASVEDMRTRNQMLETRLTELERWAQTQRARHQAAELRFQDELHALRAQIADLERQRYALSEQLHEMSGTVVRAVGEQQGAVERAIEAESKVEMKSGEIDHIKRQLTKEGTLQGKRRMKAELERESLKEQVAQLRKDNVRLAKATNANFDGQEQQLHDLRGRCRRLEDELHLAQAAKASRLDHIMRYVDASCLLRENNQLVLHLDECYLGSAAEGAGGESMDVARMGQQQVHLRRLTRQLVRMLEQSEAEAPVLVDLARNYFDDTDALEALARLVQAPFRAPSLTISLRGNRISPDGIRALTLALGKNTLVQHVYVHRDGSVHGLRGSDVVYILDVRDNSPAPRLQPQPPQPVASAQLPTIQ